MSPTPGHTPSHRLAFGRLVWPVLVAIGVAACGDAPAVTAEPRGSVEPGPPADAPPAPLSRVSAGSARVEPLSPIGGVDGCDGASLNGRAVDLGEAFAPDGRVSGRLDVCAADVYRGVASAQMRLRAELTILGGEPDRVALLRFDAGAVNGDLDPVAGRRFVAEGQAVLEWFAASTGEYGLVVDSREAGGPLDYALEVACLDGCARGMTRFPIVLLHGMGGTDQFVDLLEYWNGIPDALREAGFDVHVTVVDPLASSSTRAAQLVPQLEAILADTGARRLNLIGHSQGGIDGRALISELDFADRVASLTTLATPHRGTPLADIATGVVEASEVGPALLDAVGDVYGRLLGREDQSLPEPLRELGAVFMSDQFNPTHPNDPRVAYYSWTGHTCGLTEQSCRQAYNDEVVSPLLAPTYTALQLLGVADNDGLVGVDSAQWGEFLGVLPADHLDEVGLLLPSPHFDHLAFFAAEGERLFAAGF